MTEPPQPQSRRAAREAERATQVSSSRSKRAVRAPSGNDSAVLGGMISGAAKRARGSATRASLRTRAWLASRPRTMLAVGAVAAVLIVGGGSILAGAAAVVPPTAAVAAPIAADASGRALPETPITALRARTCAVDLSDPSLATLGASVIDVSTGEQLFDRGAELPSRSHDVQKVITGAVALAALGPDARLATRVYEGSVSGSIVIVGGGDPTLSALPSGTESVYSGAPHLDDLAKQTKDSLANLYPPKKKDDDDGGWDWRRFFGREVEEQESEAASTGSSEITTVIVDTTAWSMADKWDAAWPESERTTGSQAPVTPLMVDGAREVATAQISPRSADPVDVATTAFVGALGLSAAPAISYGAAIPEKPLLAEVFSQPISVLVAQMLQSDDNTLAEALARAVSVASGSDGSAQSLQSLYSGTLTGFELGDVELTVSDASGMNVESSVAPLTMARLYAAISAAGPGLEQMTPLLSTASGPGLLEGRFIGDSESVGAQFRGAAGSAAGVSNLGGILTADDGTVLALSLQSSGKVTSDTDGALEELVGEFHRCGGNLSNGERVA